MRLRRRAASTRHFNCRRSAAAGGRQSRTPMSCCSGTAASAARCRIKSPPAPATTFASSDCSIDRDTSSMSRDCRDRGCAVLSKAKDGGALLSALGGRKASATEALAVMADHACRVRSIVDVTSDETLGCCRPRSRRVSTSCSRTRSRWPGRSRELLASARRPRRQVELRLEPGAVGGDREDLDAVLGDHQRVLELGGALPSGVTAVQSSSQTYRSGGPSGDHRLDGERHARLE